MKTNSFRFAMVSAALLVTILAGSLPVMAASKSNTGTSQTTAATKSNLSSAVTQSYNADASVQTGMIVELKAKASNTVVPLNPGDVNNLLGVVVTPNNATIVLTPQTITQQQVLVATSGRYSVLVSNQDGPIKVGDYITISAIAGVGMKANDNQTEVIGKAASAFSGTDNVISSVTLKNTIGKSSTVAVGRVLVDMYISHNPLFQKSADYVPGFLAKVAISVAQKPVSVARIYLSAALLFLTALVVGNMLYSGVRSGMIAVGRNPLSKKSIIRSLIQTVLAGLIIFVIGVFAVYLLLKL